jgi:hypothetical protein
MLKSAVPKIKIDSNHWATLVLILLNPVNPDFLYARNSTYPIAYTDFFACVPNYISNLIATNQLQVISDERH